MSLKLDYLVPPAARRPPVSIPGKFRRRDVPIEQRTPNARRFLKKRLKAKLLPVLLAKDPHCFRCGKKLQVDDRADVATFACVMLMTETLCCLGCVNVIHRERQSKR